MFKLFAELITFHIDAAQRLAHSEHTLLKEREVAELREQFIGVLGHDLRNPLGAIAMGASTLAASSLTEEQADTVGMMKRSVERMSDLIDDALDFTRGRLGGGIGLEAKCDGDVQPLLEQVVQEVKTRWPARQVEVDVVVRETVCYDRRRLAQLFTNLLVNAMVHGKPDQPVQVKARSENGEFEFCVANAASQIPPEVLQRIFEP